MTGCFSNEYGRFSISSWLYDVALPQKTEKPPKKTQIQNILI